MHAMSHSICRSWWYFNVFPPHPPLPPNDTCYSTACEEKVEYLFYTKFTLQLTFVEVVVVVAVAVDTVILTSDNIRMIPYFRNILMCVCHAFVCIALWKRTIPSVTYYRKKFFNVLFVKYAKCFIVDSMIILGKI